MNYTCFRCQQQFSEEKDAIWHLQKVHFIIDNISPIKCLVKNCLKTYNTFKGLKFHLKTFCHQMEQEISNEEVNNKSFIFFTFTLYYFSIRRFFFFG